MMIKEKQNLPILLKDMREEYAVTKRELEGNSRLMLKLQDSRLKT